MQALILAAGKGSRLDELGLGVPKCLTPIANITILERAINNLLKVGVKSIYITVHYKADEIMKYINNHYSDIDVDIKYIDERQYPSLNHNNLYSFAISLPYLDRTDDLILLEGDIIFDISVLQNIISPKTNKVVLSEYAKYLDGNGIIVKNNKCCELCTYTNQPDLYKTVNIYYITKRYLKQLLNKDINMFLKSHDYNHYYEECFDWHKFVPVIISPTQWYEIDTPADYYAANIIYNKGKEKYNLLSQRYGGHWRLPGLIDCCYLTNPFFNPTKIFTSLSEQLERLISSYPAGDVECRKSAASLLSIQNYKQILVGNGASELINVLGKYFSNQKTFISLPTFNEYLEAFNNLEFNSIEQVKNYIIVNPNNPMGTYLHYRQIEELIINHPNITFIIDESFGDFVDTPQSFVGCDYDNVIVIKSLGKTYGVNGLKLGILYSANIGLINNLRSQMPSWNINSVAQEFLTQIKFYHYEYKEAHNKLVEERTRIIKILKQIPTIKVIDSQTDFITIQLLYRNADELCVLMLDKYNIFIKNLNNKIGLENQNYLRIAINNKNVNDYVIKCLKECLNND